MTSKFREIIEEKQFADEKRKISKSLKRLDEILDGVTWILCRKPESFHNIPDTPLWLAKTDPFPGHPALQVWFTFDDDSVNLLSIEISEPEN